MCFFSDLMSCLMSVRVNVSKFSSAIGLFSRNGGAGISLFWFCEIRQVQIYFQAYHVGETTPTEPLIIDIFDTSWFVFKRRTFSLFIYLSIY